MAATFRRHHRYDLVTVSETHVAPQRPATIRLMDQPQAEQTMPEPRQLRSAASGTAPLYFSGYNGTDHCMTSEHSWIDHDALQVTNVTVRCDRLLRW